MSSPAVHLNLCVCVLTVVLHLYKVQKQAKLIYKVQNQFNPEGNSNSDWKGNSVVWLMFYFFFLFSFQNFIGL